MKQRMRTKARTDQLRTGSNRRQPAAPSPVRRTPRERRALNASIERLGQQAETLGLLDPLDVEPAVVYHPEDEAP
jgi:hypothetical protein